MIIGLGGHTEGASQDPFFLLTAGPLDVPIISGSLSKDRREDIQIWGALYALGLNGIVRHPLNVDYGDDPPDRWLSSGDRKWGTELTELTVQNLRSQLASIRAFGRKLHDRILAKSDEFPHLRGRLVLLFADPRASLPKTTTSMLDDLERTLSIDKGYVGQGLESSSELPKELGESGFYGNYGPFHIVANNNSGSDQILISASTQGKVFLSEAIEALGVRIAAKDKAGNEILVITCGLPDGRGYTCPADSGIFQLLQEAAQQGIDILPKKPMHIRGILIHQWGTPGFIVWGDEELPWVAPK
ncbi:hypothetical protein [Actinomadura sp. DC4]|uniref:hypothetical protein n=1 Tax=Actinomadura sp. DC4 TaxID=3055069 RepID=UPI0025B10D83|nr:hypothetical protein [Actinomadura sp. DC4]MDN3357793.1 hypothetical protein [Actinomadura sp. DC4]